MQITKLNSHSKDKNLVHIHIDDEYAFTVDLNFVVKNNLFKGKVVEVDILQNLYREAIANRYYHRAINSLSIRPKSSKEIQDYLYRILNKQINKENFPKFIKKSEFNDIIKSIVQKLQQNKILDDAAFARWWFDNRISAAKKSKREMIAELQKKGVQRDIIDQVAGMYEEDEVDVIINLALKKISTYPYQKLNQQQQRQKLLVFLSNKGFRYDQIKEAMNKITQ